MLKRSIVLSAVQQGVFFEIVYGIALRPSSAENPVPKEARRNVFAGARELIKMTNGKNLILSSAVQKCMELRSPSDVINLAHLMGMVQDKATETVTANPRKVVMRGYSARNAYRGVIKAPEVVVRKSGNGHKRGADALMEETLTSQASKRFRTEAETLEPEVEGVTG